MEEYVNATEAYISVFKEQLSKKELDQSSKAGDEIYDAIRKITEKNNLNMRELLHATLGVNGSVIKACLDELEGNNDQA